MERKRCIRCGGRMGHIRQEKLQLGQYGWFTGHLDQLYAGVLAVDIYCCRDCKKLEFYAAGASAEDAGEAGSIPQVHCPHCGQLHEMDDPKCPYCGQRLMD